MCVSVEFQHISSILSSAVSKGCVSSPHVYPSPNLSLPQSPTLTFSLSVDRCHSFPPNDEHFLVLSLSYLPCCESVSKSGYKMYTRSVGFDCFWRLIRLMIADICLHIKVLYFWPVYCSNIPKMLMKNRWYAGKSSRTSTKWWDYFVYSCFQSQEWTQLDVNHKSLKRPE